MKKDKPHWFRVPNGNIEFSESFLESFCKQLEDQTTETLAIDLRQYTVIIASKQIQQATFQDVRVAYIEVLMAKSNSIGKSAIVAWFSETHPERLIEPHQDLLPNEKLQVFWADLSDIFEFDPGLMLPSISFSIPTDLNFEADWKLHHDSNVFSIYLYFEKPLLGQVANKLEEDIALTLRKWNSQSQKYNNVGLVHYQVDRIIISDKTVEIRVMEHSPEKTIQLITDAFEHRKLQENAQIFLSHSPEVDTEIIEDLVRRDTWTNFPHQIVCDNSIALAFMTPEAFAWFLPIYMIISLNLYDETDTLTTTLITCLTPPNDAETAEFERLMKEIQSFDPDLFEDEEEEYENALGTDDQLLQLFNERTASLTHQEKAAVKNYLEYVNITHGLDFPISGPKEALNLYWTEAVQSLK